MTAEGETSGEGEGRELKKKGGRDYKRSSCGEKDDEEEEGKRERGKDEIIKLFLNTLKHNF